MTKASSPFAGIACLQSGVSATTLINRADQSLYLAKRLGRNRIETDEQLSQKPGFSGTTG